MPAQLFSGALVGVDAVPVRVEADLLRRLPSVHIVGLANSSVREAAERVRSAIIASGWEWPRQRVVVNLAPADLRKDGTALDLPIAVAVLAAAGEISQDVLGGRILAGELSLCGELRPVRGVLPLALMAKEHGFKEIIVPLGSAAEAAVVEGLEVKAAQSLAEVVGHLIGRQDLQEPPPAPPDPPGHGLDLAEVRGQYLARRALELAAAGGHNLLMVGPPGCGKTMLASRLPTILPEMQFDEAVDTTKVHSVAGLRQPGAGLLSSRPFRAPHHSITAAGMLGGATLRPGEASLAHNGVLFLDELPEFRRHVLELLRGPMEERVVTLCRASGMALLPAAFSLVAAANPCPCGFRGHPKRACGCTDEAVARYMARMSGPLLDRIDLHLELAPVATDDLVAMTPGESSSAVRERVSAARRLQTDRYRGSEVHCNACLTGDAVREAARLDAEASALVRNCVESLALSGRAHSRILKVSRTIADLEGEPRVHKPHVAEAIQFRGWEHSQSDRSGYAQGPSTQIRRI